MRHPYSPSCPLGPEIGRAVTGVRDVPLMFARGGASSIGVSCRSIVASVASSPIRCSAGAAGAGCIPIVFVWALVCLHAAPF